MKPPVTIDDVARLAGVSPKTVSRVVNAEAQGRQGGGARGSPLGIDPPAPGSALG
ncbi:MAG: LacI family DNA-binding transcriptional regulator [Gammaproteobacteria bacterium]|nr:LacI family DNA-binding transcriptional regulator [Gammaproteobacteria bacterium]